MIDDELLQPTVSSEAPRRHRPWRLQSQFWVAFLGGALAGATIAILNAGRLGVPRRTRWMMAGLTAVTIAVLLALWLQQPVASSFGTFVRSGREMRLYSRIAAVALYLVLAAMQRKADARHQVFSVGEYASLWGPGAAAIFIAGTLQTALLAGIAWLGR